jgi:transposase
MLGSISRRGNRYLRAVFVQPARVVLVKLGPKHWERYGLKSWIEAAKKRLHHNVLAIALAPCARRVRGPQVGTKERPPGTNRGNSTNEELSMT